jgi:bifunctional non-homologous end joining protein LigD
MPRSSQIARVGKRKIEISNLDKILYPADRISKAELIEYYLKLAPTILAHLRGRPLSLVRFPDGIDGERFFQKNRPEWAPEWLEHVSLGNASKGDSVDYIIATEDASLVWLANLASIELHQMHCRSPHFDKPDYFVFDLDPPEDFNFRDLAGIAIELKTHIEDFGYNAFVKTTGRKGLHIVVPIKAEWSFEDAFNAAKEIAEPFVKSHDSTTTMSIRKEYRKGRVLVDIYRNRTYQSIVCAYSLRGLPGAPVSMPLRWEELEDIASSADFSIRNTLDHVLENGDAWEGIGAYSADLHTKRKTATRKKTATAQKNEAGQKLGEYSEKRSFAVTPEPPPSGIPGMGNSFVVHRHHATRLHYDLRLEQDGVLKSWAVPKGLPPRPGIKRLAVAVEDHPLEYISFEGNIPKGQYGGGDVWIFAHGKYEITKQKKDGFYFSLEGREMSGDFRIYRTRDKEWLLERVDNPQTDWLHDPIEPMLSQSSDRPPHSDAYLYEIKWDGIRALISLDDGSVRIRSRNQKDITDKFPELLIPDKAFRATSALFDAEIVCLDPDGKPVFTDVVRRIQVSGKSATKHSLSEHPAVCYVFDCLYLDGRAITNEPLARRRVWMEDAIKPGTPYRISEAVDDGAALFKAAVEMGLEGVMAKNRESRYQPGKRSDQWLKIKGRQTIECVIIGYTKGEGDRKEMFGALQLAVKKDAGLQYVGKAGTGFDSKQMKKVFEEISMLKRIERPVREKPLDDSQTVWIEPKVICEVQYSSITKDGILREPVFLRLRPDLDAL